MNENPYQPPKRRFPSLLQSDQDRDYDNHKALRPQDWVVVMVIAAAAGLSGSSEPWVRYDSVYRWVNGIPLACFFLGPILAVAFVIANCERQMAKWREWEGQPPFPLVAAVGCWFLLLVAGFVVFSSSCIGTSVMAMEMGFANRYQPSGLALGVITFMTTLLACVAVIPMHRVLRRAIAR